ncbi:MAG TPA: phage holin family protein [Steroidobacteraceae bacterium]|nr:phage holin family protein [Steroidobacteraceae bacterium]
MRSLIGRLVPALFRHLEAYAEVAGEDAREATSFVARRLLALLVAGACAFVALLMACTWILVLAWDTPWRAWTAAGLALLFAAAAAALAWPSFRRHTGQAALFFPRVRSELSRDRELIERAFDGRDQGRENGEQRAD